jgi:hypothetical protein
MSSKQEIKLLKQLIEITSNKKDKEELTLFLNKAIIGTKVVNTKFNIRSFPAKQAKAIGFKTKKSMLEFVKVNELNTKTIKSNEEFTTQVTKKLNMFNDLKAINIMHNKHKAIAEERKPKTKTVNYTAKFRIFSKLPDNKDSLIRIG